MDSRRAAVKVLQRKESGDGSARSNDKLKGSGGKGMIGIVRRETRANQGDSPHCLARIDVTYRQHVVYLNTLRRQFVKDATLAYPSLIEQQHDILTAVKRCLLKHTFSRNYIALKVSQSNSNLTAAIDKLSGLASVAPLHERLACDLRLPQYSPLRYVDPRDGETRHALLFGVSPPPENAGDEAQNSMLPVLLEVARRESQIKYPERRERLNEETMTLIQYFESNWLPNVEGNIQMVGRRPFHVRHALLMFCLSSLPDPLLPISNSDFTQYALKMLSVTVILSRIPQSNVWLLRELCDYIHRLEQYDRSVLKRFGKLLLRRVNSDLIGDGSNEVGESTVRSLAVIYDLPRKLLKT
ncbi:hypothetical protein FRC17_011332 [Serendipita sp. 399]|nr:hypothetical protein FRC17_011332 [Serendipita sp. 399]